MTVALGGPPADHPFFLWVLLLVVPLLLSVAGSLGGVSLPTVLLLASSVSFPFLSHSANAVRVHALLTSTLCVCYCVALAAWSLYTAFAGNHAPLVLEWVGLWIPVTPWQRAQLLAPPLVGLAASALAYVCVSHYDPVRRVPPALGVSTVIYILCILACSVWLSSVLSCALWVYFCALALVFAFGGDALRVCRATAPWASVAIAAQLLLMGVYSLPGATGPLAPIAPWFGLVVLDDLALNDWPFVAQLVSLNLALLGTTQFCCCSPDSRLSTPAATAHPLVRGTRYVVGVHGWAMGLTLCGFLAFLMQSVPFGVLLVFVFVAIWIPDSAL